MRGGSGRPWRALSVIALGVSVACSQGAGGGSQTGGNPGSSSAAPGSGGAAAQTGGSSGGQTSGSGGDGARVGSGGTSGGDSSGGAVGSGGKTTVAGGAGGGAGAGGSGDEIQGSGGRTASGGVDAGGGRAASGGMVGSGGQGGQHRSISFGTFLDPQAVVASAQQLAKSVTQGGSSWQAKGDQHRTYRFAVANTNEPYRLYVPTDWDGKAQLPLVMFLHGSGNDENSYVDANGKQMITLAQQHGFILVSPLGHMGAYGNFLRLSAPFGDEADAAMLIAQVTPDSEKTNELSEQDVINVLELVLNEYPVNRSAVFLTGHSMGSGGTWYLGGKYAQYWKALAPMSGPFVEETGYPWDAVRPMGIFVTEGTQAPSLSASHLLRDWLKTNGFNSKYEEVNADHPGMVKLVLPDVFDYFATAK